MRAGGWRVVLCARIFRFSARTSAFVAIAGEGMRAVGRKKQNEIRES